MPAITHSILRQHSSARHGLCRKPCAWRFFAPPLIGWIVQSHLTAITLDRSWLEVEALFLHNHPDYMVGMIMIGLVSVAFFFQRRHFGRELSAIPAEVVEAGSKACPPAQHLMKERAPSHRVRDDWLLTNNTCKVLC
jgi:hypothetical protein